MNRRMRRVLGIRGSGAAGRHRSGVERERSRSQREAHAVSDQDSDIEDPEGAEEEATLRDAQRGVGPRLIDGRMPVGEFVDDLPPAGTRTTVVINGQLWNVKKLDWPEEMDAGQGEPDQL